MNVPSWLYDAWFISIASIIIGFVLEPLIVVVFEKIRSIFGDFSGIYLALTSQPYSDVVIIEIARCQHIGTRLKGVIEERYIAEYKNRKITELAHNEGKYRFNGILKERLFVLNYDSLLRGVKGLGSITLQGDNSGRVFTGYWSGFSAEKLENSPCIWLRVENNYLEIKELALLAAEKVLSIEKSPWNTGKILAIYPGHHRGKSKYLHIKERLQIGPIRRDVDLLDVWDEYRERYLIKSTNETSIDK